MSPVRSPFPWKDRIWMHAYVKLTLFSFAGDFEAERERATHRINSSTWQVLLGLYSISLFTRHVHWGSCFSSKLKLCLPYRVSLLPFPLSYDMYAVHCPTTLSLIAVIFLSDSCKLGCVPAFSLPYTATKIHHQTSIFHWSPLYSAYLEAQPLKRVINL